MAGGLLLLLVVAVIAGVVGVAFGIVVLAPRLTRFIDRHEEPRDAPD
jgi:hypothetical protein